MFEAVKAYYKANATTVKWVGGLLLGVLVFLGGWWLYDRYLKPKKDSGETGALGDIDEDNLTHQPLDYAIYADNLEMAMQHTSFNPWEVGSRVVDIWKQMRNADDIRQTIQAFGLRKNYVFGVPKYDKGVIHWMQDELPDAALEQVREIFQSFNVPF